MPEYKILSMKEPSARQSASEALGVAGLVSREVRLVVVAFATEATVEAKDAFVLPFVVFQPHLAHKHPVAVDAVETLVRQHVLAVEGRLGETSATDRAGERVPGLLLHVSLSRGRRRYLPRRAVSRGSATRFLFASHLHNHKSAPSSPHNAWNVSVSSFVNRNVKSGMQNFVRENAKELLLHMMPSSEEFMLLVSFQMFPIIPSVIVASVTVRTFVQEDASVLLFVVVQPFFGIKRFPTVSTVVLAALMPVHVILVSAFPG